MTLILTATAIGVLISILLALVAGYYSGRRASIDVYADLGAAFDKERLTGAILRDEVLELMGRIELERKRVAGLDSKMRQVEKSKQKAADEGAEGQPGPAEFAGMAREDIIDQISQRYQPGHG